MPMNESSHLTLRGNSGGGSSEFDLVALIVGVSSHLAMHIVRRLRKFTPQRPQVFPYVTSYESLTQS